jgi:alkylated DNA nucleotide flippase Atl1
MKTRTPWREKLERVTEPKIVPVPPKWRKRFGDGTMAIPRGADVDAVMRKVRKGRVITQSQIRAELARIYGVDHACPLVTGIMVRIAAEASEEQAFAGAKRVTPWWRVVRDDGSLLEKCPGGPAEQKRRLEAEGLRVEARGKRLRVAALIK